MRRFRKLSRFATEVPPSALRNLVAACRQLSLAKIALLKNGGRVILHHVNPSSRIIPQSHHPQTRVDCHRPRPWQAAVARGASLESSSRSACLMPKFLRSAMNGDGASMLCHMFAVADAVNKRGLFAPRSLRVGQNMYSTIHVINTRIEISETYHTRRT